jgi:hypothetical protein
MKKIKITEEQIQEIWDLHREQDMEEALKPEELQFFDVTPANLELLNKIDDAFIKLGISKSPIRHVNAYLKHAILKSYVNNTIH